MPNPQNPLEQAALKPKKVSGDMGSVEEHSLKDQIELDKYLEQKKFKGKFRIGQITPGSAVGR